MIYSPGSATGDSAEAVRQTILEAPAPAFSIPEAESIAQETFGIQASAQALDSERNQNFQLLTKEGSRWVLKIANPAENPALLDMQTAALLHIAEADPGLAIPRVKMTRDGVLFHEVNGNNGRRFIVVYVKSGLKNAPSITSSYQVQMCPVPGWWQDFHPNRFLLDVTGKSQKMTV